MSPVYHQNFGQWSVKRYVHPSSIAEQQEPYPSQEYHAERRLSSERGGTVPISSGMMLGAFDLPGGSRGQRLTSIVQDCTDDAS